MRRQMELAILRQDVQEMAQEHAPQTVKEEDKEFEEHPSPRLEELERAVVEST